MMVAVFVAMLLALAAAWSGAQRLAISLLFLGFVFSSALFLFEIYSPDYGFRMPWIQTQGDQIPVLPAAREV